MSELQPGQTEPNVFERAILERLAKAEPSLRSAIARLRVLSREYTGVGSFTRFQSSMTDAPARRVSLGALIKMPGVEAGMGAVLLCRGEEPEELEVFAYGDAHWNGRYEGFAIEGDV